MDGGEGGEEGEISPMCESKGHRPLRGRCPKSIQNALFSTFRLDHYRRTKVSTDQQTNGPTDRRKDKASYRVACPQLKRREHRQIGYKHGNGGWNHTQTTHAKVKPVYRLTSMIDFSFPTFSAFLYFILLLLTAYRKAGGSINDIGMQWT